MAPDLILETLREADEKTERSTKVTKKVKKLNKPNKMFKKMLREADVPVVILCAGQYYILYYTVLYHNIL